MLKSLFMALAAASIINAAPTDDASVVATFKFGVDLYTAALAEKLGENVIVSPLSVQTALGLVLMGADGTTAEQIARGSRFKTGDRSNVASFFQNMLRTYSNDDKLKIVNKVYLKTGYELNPQFSETAKNQFGSETETVNFAESDIAADNINSWVEDNTNGKIKDLISSDSLNEDTRMVLINAVHFKAPWQDHFYKEATRKRPFWISETESIEVDTMYGNIDVRSTLINELDARLILIPYKDTSLTMAILLPNSRTGLQAMENKLRNFDFTSLSLDTRSENVELLLPKFKVESNVDLKVVLSKMGMVDMFTKDASFPSLINTDEHLKVDEAVHKTYINVDEEGTEAAAATGFKMVADSIPPNIQVDHPFLFAILNQNDVAFIGSVRKL